MRDVRCLFCCARFTEATNKHFEDFFKNVCPVDKLSWLSFRACDMRGMARLHPIVRSFMSHLLPLPFPPYQSLPFLACSLSPGFARQQFYRSAVLWPRLQAQAVANEATQLDAGLPLSASGDMLSPSRTEAVHGEAQTRKGDVEGSEYIVEAPEEDTDDAKAGSAGKRTVRFKVLHEGEHSLDDRSIPWYTWRVLRGLHKAGYEAYLVGGSVRDLFLKETPKDFDVLSTADPHEVRKLFPGKAIVVGRRFPICHVRAGSAIITEVSSFNTEVREIKGRGRKKPLAKVKKRRLDKQPIPAYPRKYVWDDRDTARWQNSLKRDFTVNGLIYEPFTRVVYDYVGAVKDLKARKVRTIAPADDSFNEDAARYLRAIRIAGRLGLSLDGNVVQLLETSAPSVASLGKSRLMGELHILMAYGAAEASLRLLWRFRLLELLLPLQAAYLHSVSFARRSKKTNFFFELMANLDRQSTPDNPCQGSLWTALLGFHLAVVECKPPEVVSAAAALAVHDRRGLLEAAKKAQRIHTKVQAEGLQSDPNLDSPEAGGSRGVGDAMEQDYDMKDGLKSEGREAVDAVEGKPVASKSARKVEAGIARAAGKLLDSAEEYVLDHVDFTLTAKLTRELLGIEVGDLVMIPRSYSFRARRILSYDQERGKALTSKHQKESMFGRTDSFGHDKNGDGALGDDEMKKLTFMFSRIVLGTLYPRTQS